MGIWNESGAEGKCLSKYHSKLGNGCDAARRFFSSSSETKEDSLAIQLFWQEQQSQSGTISLDFFSKCQDVIKRISPCRAASKRPNMRAQIRWFSSSNETKEGLDFGCGILLRKKKSMTRERNLIHQQMGRRHHVTFKETRQTTWSWKVGRVSFHVFVLLKMIGGNGKPFIAKIVQRQIEKMPQSLFP